MKVKRVILLGLPILAVLVFASVAGLSWRAKHVTADPKYDCFDAPDGKPKDPKHPLYGYDALTKIRKSNGPLDYCEVTFKVNDPTIAADKHPEVGLRENDTLNFADGRGEMFRYTLQQINGCSTPVIDVAAGHDQVSHAAGPVKFKGNLLKSECDYKISFDWKNGEHKDPHISVGK